MSLELDKDKIIRKYQQQLADTELRAIVAESLVEQYQENERANADEPAPAE